MSLVMLAGGNLGSRVREPILFYRSCGLASYGPDNLTARK
jgi:hypothetical protein